MINKREQEFLDTIADKSKTYVEHPQWFKLSNGTKYFPDFYCKEDDEYIEVAGTRQASCANKHKYEQFQKEYPTIKFKVVHLWKQKATSDAQVARNHNVSPMMVCKLIRGENKTLNVPLAIELAEHTGKNPLDFINPKIHYMALIAHPELGKKVSVHKQKVAQAKELNKGIFFN